MSSKIICEHLFEAARHEAEATVETLIQDGVLSPGSEEERKKHISKIAIHIIDHVCFEYQEAKANNQIH